MTSLFSGVQRLRDSGLSVIPIKADGSKKADLPTWSEYQQRPATEAELRRWFRNGVRCGVGIIAGPVSGNLEILDFDAPELISEWCALVEEAAPGLLDQLPQVETPTGGRHIFYRCAEIAGNQKLATRADEHGKPQTLIETRGQGGYVVTAGSPAACHPSGQPYKLINGDLKTIPTITPQERDILLTCARSFNEYLKPAQHVAPERALHSKEQKPGEEFNQRGDVRGLLEKHGWRRLHPSSRGEVWARPGANHTSATLFADGSLYVFSTNAHPFEHDRAYSPFAIFATLEHGGDFKTAAKALAADGYGEPAKTQTKGETKKAKQPAKTRIGDVTFTVVEDGDLPGVYATDADGNREFICSPLHVEADTRDEHSGNWGRLLRFPDRDGVAHQWPMPMELLSGDGREYRAELLRQGLVIGSTRKARLLLETYLSKKPDKTVLCVTRQGWHRGAFVLPDESIGEQSEAAYLQTLSSNHLFRVAGTVEDWRDHLGRYCSGNNRLLLAVSVALVAPLLEPLQGENGGWHFTGTSSTGKTTALFVAGSIHGGGGDKGFIRRWRATINGLESVAETHHDALLCLDEIAECRPDDVNEAAYMLANGQGKTRQARGGALRRTLEWRLTFLSSGELSLADHVAQTGKRVRAGQEVRVINLPADAGAGLGLFEELHGFNSGDEFARHLQRSAREYFGAPLRAFLHGVAGRQDELRKRYRIFEAALLEEMLPKTAASEVSRVAHRFALAAFAGELATELNITGWQPEDATAAVKTLFATWLAARGTEGSTDEENALRQVRRFLEMHGQSRFQQLGLSGERIVNRAGYVEALPEDDGLIYYVLPEVFRSEVCGGFDHKNVAKMLNQRGCLRVTHDLRCQKRLPEGNKKVYAILSKTLED